MRLPGQFRMFSCLSLWATFNTFKETWASEAGLPLSFCPHSAAGLSDWWPGRGKKTGSKIRGLFLWVTERSGKYAERVKEAEGGCLWGGNLLAIYLWAESQVALQVASWYLSARISHEAKLPTQCPFRALRDRLIKTSATVSHFDRLQWIQRRLQR